MKQFICVSTKILRARGHCKVTRGFVLWFLPPCVPGRNGKGSILEQVDFYSPLYKADACGSDDSLHPPQPGRKQRSPYVWGLRVDVFAAPFFFSNPGTPKGGPHCSPLWDPRHTASFPFKTSEYSLSVQACSLARTFSRSLAEVPNLLTNVPGSS